MKISDLKKLEKLLKKMQKSTIKMDLFASEIEANAKLAANEKAI